MAIAQSDGSIILTTKVDTTGIKQGTKEAIKFAELSVNEQRRLAQSLSGVYRKQGLAQSEAQKKAWADLKANTVEAKNLTVAMKDAGVQTKSFGKQAQTSGNKATAAFTAVGSALLKLASYFIGIQTVFKFVDFSREAGEMATQQEANVQRLIDIYGEASNSIGDFIDTSARAIGMSKTAAASFASVYGNLFSVWADQRTNAELTAQYLNMTAVVASKSGRTVADVQERVRSGLLGNTEAIEDLGIFVNVKTIEMTEAFKKMADGRSWEQLGAYEQQQIRTLAILEQATQKYGNEVANTTALTRAQNKAAYEDMKATWGQFVNVVLMPVLKVATQIMNIITIGLQAVAGLTGKTIESTEGISSSIGNAVDNQNNLTDAVKETNKELKKSLASFDTIEILSSNTSESSAGADSTVSVGGGIGGALGIDMESSKKAEETVNESLLGVMAVAGLSLAAIGLILIATGHIGWGIGFLLAGIAIFSVSAATLKSDAVSKKTKDALTNVIVVAGLVAIVLGVLCCVAQRWGIGIGLILLGAGAIVTAVALNWDSIKEKMQGTFGDILAIVGVVAIVLGVLLCFAQQWGIGIGLILTGALSVGSVVAVNWDTISEKVTETMTKIGDWLKTWGLLVLGVLLCLTGVGVPLGIVLIKKGAENLSTSENPKWNTIGDKIQETMDAIFDWLATWGLLVLGIILCLTGVGIPLGIVLMKKGAENLASSENPDWKTTGEKIQETFNEIGDWIKTWGLLVLGIILCLSGIGIPLGIALIKKGAENLTTAKDPTWNAMLDKIKETWKAIKNYWNTNIAKYFTAEWWGNLAKTAVNGLLKWFINGLNRLIDKLNSFGFTLPEVLGGKRVGFNISRLTIPQLAQGAVLPANQPFLAVVGDQKQGTNIEAPANLIKQMAMEAIQETGFTGGQTVREEHYYLDETELMSIIYRLVRGGERLNGENLVVGGAS